MRLGTSAVFLIVFISLLPETMHAAPPASMPAATAPNTQPADEILPVGAIRRFGDRRYFGTASEDFRSADFSPDGNRIVTAGDLARIWDVNTASVVTMLDDQGQLSDHAAYLNADQIVVAWHTRHQPVELIVHDAHTGRRLRSLDCDEQLALVDLTVSPDGKRIAAVGQKITLIDAASGATVASLGPVQAQGNNSVALPTPRVQFTSDAKKLLAIGTDMRAVFYDARTGEPLSTQPFATRHGATLVDDQTIAVLTDTNQLYDVASRLMIPIPDPLMPKKPVSSDPSERSICTCVRMSSKGVFAVACSAPRAQIFLWNTMARPVPSPRSIPTRDVMPMSLVFSRDGKKLAVLSSGTRLEVRDVQSGQPICGPATHMGDITAMDVSKDGRTLLTADCRGTLALWNIDTGERTALCDGAGYFGIAPTYGAARFSPDGKSILIGAQSGAFQLSDAKTLKLIRRMARPKAATRPVAEAPQIPGYAVGSPDCKLVAEWFPGQVAHIFDVEKSVHLQAVPTALPRPAYMEFSPDGKTLAIPADGGINLHLISTTGVISKRVAQMHVTIVAKPRFTSDGNRVGLFDLDQVSVWEASAGTAGDSGGVVCSIPVLSNGTGDFDDTGQLFFAADFLRTPAGDARDLRHPGVTVFETETGNPVLRIADVQATVEAVHIVPHRPWLITAGADGTAMMWDLSTLLKDPQLARMDDAFLWAQMARSDPAPAYRAAAELFRRNHLIQQATAIQPAVLQNHNPAVIQRWIEQLSSPDSVVKEAAHKHLETAGAAVGPAVRRALAGHPGGETEERLADLIRIIGTDLSRPASLDLEMLRAQRLIRWLKWSPDPAATEEIQRLTGEHKTDSTTQPASTSP